MRPHEMVRGVEASAPRRVSVPEAREPLVEEGAVRWTTSEGAPIQSAVMRSPATGYVVSGTGWTREEAMAALTAEAHERWVLRCLGRYSNGAAVWTDEAGAVAAAQREVAERCAVMEWWSGTSAPAEHKIGSRRLSGALRAVFGPEREHHALLLTSAHALAVVVVVTYRADSGGIVFAAAAHEDVSQSERRAGFECCQILGGVRHLSRDWREHGFHRWATAASAPWLWPQAGKPRVGAAPLPRPAVLSAHGGYAFALVNVPEEVAPRSWPGYPYL